MSTTPKPKLFGYTMTDIQSCLNSLYQLIKFRIKKKTYTNSSKETKDNSEDTSHCQDPITIINYIKESIDVLIEIAVNEQVDDYISKKEEEQQEYESILIKYENDIRGHIRVEHQLKLYADNLQVEAEQNERKFNELKDNNDQLKKVILEKTNTISAYEKESKQLRNENNSLRIENKLLIDKETSLNEEITQLKSHNETLKEKMQTLKTKVVPHNNNNISMSSSSSINAGYVPKRVISTMQSQLSKRNKNYPSNFNIIMNRSLSNYNNNSNHHINYSLLDSTTRSISKQHEELLRKINDYNISVNNGNKKHHSNNSSSNIKHLHRNRSVGNLNTKKNYTKIHLIKDMLLKHSNVSKENININNNNNNNSIIITKNHIHNNHSKSRANHSISNNTSNNSSSVVYQLNNNNNNNNNMNSHNKIYTKRRKYSNRKITTSLITSNSTGSFINKINILSTSPKQNNNNNNNS